LNGRCRRRWLWNRVRHRRNVWLHDFRNFGRILACDSLAKPDERLPEFTMIDVRSCHQGEKQHDADGSPQREAIHPTGRCRVGLPFQRRERLQDGRRHASRSSGRGGHGPGDLLHTRGRSLFLREQNLNLGRRFGDGFWNHDRNDWFRGSFCGRRPRADGGKLQEWRQ